MLTRLEQPKLPTTPRSHFPGGYDLLFRFYKSTVFAAHPMSHIPPLVRTIGSARRCRALDFYRRSAWRERRNQIIDDRRHRQGGAEVELVDRDEGTDPAGRSKRGIAEHAL